MRGACWCVREPRALKTKVIKAVGARARRMPAPTARRAMGPQRRALLCAFVALLLVYAGYAVWRASAWHGGGRSPVKNARAEYALAPSVPPVQLPDDRRSGLPAHGEALALFVMCMSQRGGFERRSAIRYGWKKNIGNAAFFVGDSACEIPHQARTTPWSCMSRERADPKQISEYQKALQDEQTRLEEENEAHPDMVMLPMKDFYRALPKKLKLAYEWSIKNTQAQWFLKIDDDSAVRIGPLESFLSQIDRVQMYVIGSIRQRAPVPKSGKWAEAGYSANTYPTFANGAEGHVVSRKVAQRVYLHDGFEYQGEDVSLGIWISEMKLPVIWKDVTGLFVNNGDCHNQKYLVIGHNISPDKMLKCFQSKTPQAVRNMNKLDATYASKWNIEIVNTSSLDVKNRFDIVVKTAYALFLRKENIPLFVQKMYTRHLQVWNNFKEPCTFIGERNWFDTTRPCQKKQTHVDFIKSFKKLFQSVSVNGFDYKESAPPVTVSNFPLNGAHRIATAIALEVKKMPIQRIFSLQMYNWGCGFFLNSGMETHYTDFAMLQWTSHVKNVTTVLFWPEAVRNKNKMLNAKKMVDELCGPVIYEKSIFLNRYGISTLATHSYGQQNWLMSKIQQLQSVFNDEQTKLETLVLFVAPISEHHLRSCKQKIRSYFDLTNLKSAMHIPDHHEETVVLARAVLNKNSVLFMNSGKKDDCLYVAAEIASRLELKSVNPSVFLLPEDIMVDSGAVMSFFGLRERTDVDVLFQGIIDPTIIGNKHGMNIQVHEFEHNRLKNNGRAWGAEHLVSLSVDELFTNPQYYGFCYGLKYVSLQQLMSYKAKRGEVGKDEIDVQRIQEFLRAVDKGRNQTNIIKTISSTEGQGDVTKDKKNMNVLVFVLSHSNRKKDGISGVERRMAIRNTWKKSIPESSFFSFVLDRATSSDLKENETFSDMLFLDTSQQGQAIGFGEKFKKLTEWALSNYKFDAMMRIDDDNYMCIDHLLHDLKTVMVISRNFVWGWWFGPRMSMNEDYNKQGPWGDVANEFCTVFSGNKNADNNWRPDEMAFIVGYDVLRKVFDESKNGATLPVFNLMDETLIKWLRWQNVTYVIDNSRFFRGQGGYTPELPAQVDMHDFCDHYISFHKAHPMAMSKLWNKQGTKKYKPISIHPKCIAASNSVNKFKVIIESNISDVYIDVGTHFMTEFKNVLLNNANSFVVGFEPTPHTFHSHVSSFSHPRLKMFNAAIGPRNGVMDFYTNVQGAHCNSLQQRNKDFVSPLQNGKKAIVHCQKQGDPIQIATVPLQDIISQLPSVKYLKIDAQGYDFEVLKSIGSELYKIKRIKVECQDVGNQIQLLLYVNVTQCDVIERWMLQKKWRLTSKTPSNSLIKEFDIVFDAPTTQTHHDMSETRKLLSTLEKRLNMNDDTWMGVNVKTFGSEEQSAFYRLFRFLYKSKMYPLDVESKQEFHTEPNWGSKRGHPIGRYYLHRWLEQMDREIQKMGLHQARCLEIGDGHFVKDNTERAWKQRSGKMIHSCSDDSLSLDLSDPRADLHANLESPFETLKEKSQILELKRGFDIIVCAQVFEHIDYPLQAMKGLASLLRDDGIILFSVPFISNPVHGHDVHRFTKTGVENLAKGAGLTVISNEPMGNSLSTIGYLLELSSDDFTEDELLSRDKHQYVGVYSVLKKTKGSKISPTFASDTFGTSGKSFSGEIVRKFDSASITKISIHKKNDFTMQKDKQKCAVWAVVTTIFDPSPAVKLISSRADFCLVVVLDKKSTPESWNDMDKMHNVHVLDIKEQELIFPLFSSMLPWNHFGRKNIGYLFAITRGAEAIWDFDDDNIGIPSIEIPEIVMEPVESQEMVNPYPYFGTNETRSWPRGLPFDDIKNEVAQNLKKQIDKNKVGVIQSLAHVQPDVDAVYRFTREVPFNFTNSNALPFLVPKSSFAPFNAQATLWFKCAFKFLLLPVTVHGRVSDIWRSYIAQSMFDHEDIRTLFVFPKITQIRNAHENKNDFAAEKPLYEKAKVLVHLLQSGKFKTLNATYEALYERDFLALHDVEILQVWQNIIEPFMV